MVFDSWPTKEEYCQKLIETLKNAYSVMLNQDYLKSPCIYWARGCSRRLRALIRSVFQINIILPFRTDSEYSKIDSGKQEDINIYFNSFLLNISGYLDNLSYIVQYHYPKVHIAHGKVCLKNLVFESVLSEKEEIVQKLVKDYLINHSVDQEMRNYSAHRLYPYLVSVFDSDDDIMFYKKYNEEAIKFLSQGDLDKYEEKRRKSEERLKIHGNMVSDCIESNKSYLINSIHCYIIEELQSALDLTTNLFKVFTGCSHRQESIQDPHLADLLLLERMYTESELI